MSAHTEEAFEQAIEAHLLSHGWMSGAAGGYDPALGLDPSALAGFVQETQPREWDKVVAAHGSASAASARLAKRVSAEIDARGTIDVLRHGVKERGASVTVAYFRPTHGLTASLGERYAANRVAVTRQVHHSESNRAQSLDLLLSVNGIPVATAELKNQFTGQGVQDAIDQYRDPAQRNPADRVFGRCVAHFAVDPTLVFVTTHLAGGSTVFLPFNQGSGGAGAEGGKGNPASTSGHASAYLWEQVWQRDNWLDLLHRFVQELPATRSEKRSVLFPRYHQWDVVRRLVDHAALHGAGHSYLLQHSAGSGKSNSIAWLAHRLADLHSASDTKVFDKVVVITDRTVLDKQLQATISGLDHVRGMLKRIDGDSQQLRAALQDTSTKIVITTLQKFPVIAGTRLDGRRVAVIVDEAHSSQSGEAARSVKAVLGGAGGSGTAEDRDGQDELADHLVALTASAASRGRQGNLSFFAFTATPKGKTLQLFGERDPEAPGPSGEPTYRPFHLYSMRQAIEESFILDVLASYVTYQRYYRLSNGATSEDPEVEKGRAAVALARYVDLHPSNLDQRAEIVVEHFRTHVAPRIGGAAKAMVVTRSRLHAVRYHQAIERYLARRHITGITAMVAFSGTVPDPDTRADHTESAMNGFPESATARRFHEDGQVLVVAEKYQTGFDEPLLHTMYVDRKLEGVKAVQTLSRLNRTRPGKDDTFVLDFVNTAEEMREHFAPFWSATWTEETDPDVLHNLAGRIAAHHVIDPDEQQRAVAAFLGADGKPKGAAHAAMWSGVNPAVARIVGLPAEEQREVRDVLGAFVRAYAFLGQVITWTDTDLESLSLYAKLLLTALPELEVDRGGIDLGDTALEYIGHRAGESAGASVVEGDSDGGIATFAGEGRGGDQDPLTAHLSAIIAGLNEAFGIDLSYADSLHLFYELPQHLADDPEVQRRAVDNTEEQFGLTVRRDDVAGAIFDRRDAGATLLKMFTEDERFAEQVMARIRRNTWAVARQRA